MNELIARRGKLKGQLTRLASYLIDITSNDNSIDTDQVRIRAEKARETWDDFQQIQESIECDGSREDSDIYRVEFEELYYENVAKCERIIRESSASLTNASTSLCLNSPLQVQHPQTSIKLAALQIPTFSGVYTEWAPFYDIYQALVHNNATLSDVQKFFYLRSALAGDAENVIQCLQTTSDNYKVAWDSLVARYENKKILVQVHIQALFDLEAMKKESALHLRKLVDALTGHLKALESLGQKPNDWGALLLHLVTSKLDSRTMREWEISSPKSEVPEVKDLINFIQRRFRVLEAVESTSQINASQQTNHRVSTQAQKKGSYSSNMKSTAFATTGEIKCFVCKKTHTIYNCPLFLSLSISERIKKATELNLCKICLRLHGNEKCRSRRCPICNRTHNGLLHLPRNEDGERSVKSQNTMAKGKPEDENADNTATSVNAHVYRKTKQRQILLSTATVWAYDVKSNPVLCRVLLDSGSQHNFITEAMAQHLRLKRQKMTCSVIGINGASHTASHKVITTLKSRYSDYSVNLQFFVLPRLTAKLPLSPIDITCLNIPADLKLADPNLSAPKAIDMLVGAEIFFDLLGKGQIRPVSSGPIFHNTHFGWIASGPMPLASEQPDECSLALLAYTDLEKVNLESQMAAFWRLEEVQPDQIYTHEEQACKQHFEETVRREKDGRFTVALPFRDEYHLGNSYEIALRRFFALERRLQANKELKKNYIKFMNEYLVLGHMEAVLHMADESRCYYVPHHAVHNENSISTKLRVVFDASAKTSANTSLNDVLLKGPCMQEELVEIMSRFRTHKYVMTADIKKMYRQFWVAEDHRDYQRIVWREDPSQPLGVFRLKTVTYGVITASYLATACLKKLAEEESHRYPEACQALTRDFYMDDYLGGAASIQAALKLRDDLIMVLKGAGLELCKWSSNEPNLLSGIKTVSSQPVGETGLDSKEKMIKILGLYWNQENDAYQYKVLLRNPQIRATKRVILSEIASIFDPLGLISPVVICFKIIMQKLWALNLDWDAVLPTALENEWQNHRGELASLNSLTIERSIIGTGDVVEIQLHGFADASLTSYGAALYLRVLNSNGEVTTNLICAKSRVAPVKVITLPRLELLAAVLLARLTSKYVKSLNVPIKKKYYWSDSTVVLAWIASQSTRWKTFVAHRVGEIQELTSITQWQHVGTKDNPADVVSRGCSATQIQGLKLWWKGPEWLSQNESTWPNPTSCNEQVIPEERTISHVVTSCDLSLLERYSSFNKLIRVISYCVRFVHNASRKPRMTGPLQVCELEASTTLVVQMVQKHRFTDEIRGLKKKPPQVSSKSPLARLHPFLDEKEVLRVGGRLANSTVIDWGQRHPIILPAKSALTKLIFLHEHERLMHGGPQAILASLRTKYWPINGRNVARSVVHQCVKCFRYRPVVTQPIMGDLPRARIEPARAFLKTGVDFAGPFYVKASLRRNAPVNKAYAAVWVCFATKAVHIELVNDLSTQSFLNALQRFCDRRGLCTDIYSDNATNFVGANNLLQELKNLFLSGQHQQEMQGALSRAGIQWHFIPPRSPHFGGLWEAAIKSLKSHLYRTLGNAALTFEELNTVLVRVEAILNSRPITPLSSSPTDLSVLTPGHFLIGDSLTAIPERDETFTPENRLTRWRRVAKIAQHFWSRWSREYLHQLQERGKWFNSRGPNLEVGTIVLIQDDNLPPLKWSIGRVTEVHHGADAKVRVATVQTSRGKFKRAVRTLCPLPFEGNRPV